MYKSKFSQKKAGSCNLNAECRKDEKKERKYKSMVKDKISCFDFHLRNIYWLVTGTVHHANLP